MKNKIITFLLAVASPLYCLSQALFTSDGLLIGTRSKLGSATVCIKVPQGMLMRDKVTDASGYTDLKHFSFFFPPSNSSDPDIQEMATTPCIGGTNAISFYYEDYQTKEDIKARRFLKKSDRNAKTEIESLKGMLSALSATGGSTSSAKRMRSVAAQSTNGFSVASLAEKIPTSVLIEENDTSAYTFEIIPMLTAAVNELKSIVESQREQIDRLAQENLLRKESNEYVAKIYSVTPNPTNGLVEIRLSIAKPATLTINDLNANKSFETNLGEPGDQVVTADLSNYRKGIYHAILTVDGHPCDVSRIIKE